MMSKETPQGRIFQINTSHGGVPKLAQAHAEVSELGVIGDKQDHIRVHGGPDRAVCLYSLERILALQGEGHPIFPGAMGENITVAELDWNLIGPGIRLKLGETVVLEVTRYTTPCNLLEPFFCDGAFDRVSHTSYPGWARVYTRVLALGHIKIGDLVCLE